MQTLRHRSLNPLKWSEFILTPEGVKFRERDIRGTREGTVEYDRIGREPTYFSHHSVIALIGAILFTTISAVVGVVEWRGGDTESYAWLVWLGVAAVVFVYYSATRTSGYMLRSEFGAIPIPGRKVKVESFVTALGDQKLAYLEDRVKKRLAVMDPSEVDRYLLALQEGGVLSDDQYMDIRSKVGLHREYGSRIGFAR